MNSFRLMLLFITAFTFSLKAQMDSLELEKRPLDTNKIKAWQSKALDNNLNYTTAIDYAEKALTLAEELQNELWVSRAYLTLGIIRIRESSFEEAKKAILKAEAFFKKNGPQKDLAEAYRLLGMACQNLDEKVSAIDYFQQALRINIALGNRAEEGSVCVNIGGFYGVQGDFEVAKEYFIKAAEAFESVGDSARKHVVYLNLAAVNKDLGDHQQSIYYSLLARMYFEEMQHELRLGIISYNLGISYRELGNFTQSIDELKQALVIFENLGDKLRINGANLELAKVWAAQEKYPEALKHGFIALKGFRSIKMNSQVIRALEFIADTYERQSKFKKANQYLKKYISVKDSLNLYESNARVAEIEERFQSELKEQQLLDAQNKIELQQLRAKRQETRQNILIAFLAAVGIVLILLFNQYRQRQRNNHILQEKNTLIQRSLSEKDTLLKEIHHRVKNNLQYVSSLLNLQARHLNEPEAKSVLLESKNRIHSMALVHQKLYQEDNLTGVLMEEYLHNLISSLKSSYRISDQEVNLVLEVDELQLDIDSAMPIGLLVNEAVTNCFKYAIDKHKGLNLHLSLKSQGKTLILEIADDGPGMDDKAQKNQESFGFKLMQSFAEKLGGDLQIKSEKGLCLALEISNFKKV